MSDFSIRDSMFCSYSGSDDTVIVPDGVTKLAPYAFYCGYFYKKIVLPEGLKTIGYEAFCDCRELTEITIPSTVRHIHASAFERCHRLEHVYFRPSDVPLTLKEALFCECRSLRSISLPDRLQAINPTAFEECDALKQIRVRSAKGPFFDIDGLLCKREADGSITLHICPPGRQGVLTVPDGVNTVGALAFFKCRHLTRVILPESTVSIRDNAFFDCPALKEVIAPNAAPPFNDQAGLLCLTHGFLTCPERYRADIIERYHVCIRHHMQELLDVIFRQDNVPALAYITQQRLIAPALFESWLLNPALQARATQCVAFLLNNKPVLPPIDL